MLQHGYRGELKSAYDEKIMDELVQARWIPCVDSGVVGIAAIFIHYSWASRDYVFMKCVVRQTLSNNETSEACTHPIGI